jgi:hypothetical protein
MHPHALSSTGTTPGRAQRGQDAGEPPHQINNQNPTVLFLGVLLWELLTDCDRIFLFLEQKAVTARGPRIAFRRFFYPWPSVYLYHDIVSHG